MIATLLGESPSNINQLILSRWNDSAIPYHTSIDILTRSVYSMTSGYILFVGTSADEMKSVNVLCNDSQMIRYCNMKKLSVSAGDTLLPGQYIGECTQHVKIEYCTEYQGSSKWPVRFFTHTFYKQNPEGLFTGTIQIQSDADSHWIADNDTEYNYLTEEESKEYSNSRGTKHVEF